MDPASAFKTGAAAISLVTAIAKLAKEIDANKEPNDPPTLRELLERIRLEAVRLSASLEHRLSALVEHVVDYGLNPGLSLDDQLKNLSWYNVMTRFRLKTFREECGAIYLQLTTFLDDATALLLCQNQIQTASSAFQASLDAKRQLDQLFLTPGLTLKMLLDGLLAAARKASADLQA